jgi:flagellar hook-length control protein FliK
LELVVLPKTLGKINIQLATSGDTINIKISTDNPNTAVVLNSALSDIEKFLSEGGIKLLSTGIGSGGSQHNNDKKSSDLSSVGSRERKNGEHEDIATSATKVKSKLGTHPGNYDYEV